MNKTHYLILTQLDNQLKEWRSVAEKYPRPRIGWVKMIRKALGMTAFQLAKRLKLKRARIVQLERAESNDAVSLRTLREAARAMECELVYALVPKRSLQDILEKRAYKIAKERIERVSHSMSLEEQKVEGKQQTEQIEQLAKSLLENSLRKLWDEGF